MNGERLVYRIRKGMIFWYDPFPGEDKTGHSMMVDGVAKKSCVQAGHRPWIVVSADEYNAESMVCSVCPITSAVKGDFLNHVTFPFQGKPATVLTEQITTVDMSILKDYDGFVSEEIIRDIDKALTAQLGIQPVVVYKDFGFNNAMTGIEKIIERAISEKVEKMGKNEIPMKDIEDAAFRLGEMFENLVTTKLEKIYSEPCVIEETVTPKEGPFDLGEIAAISEPEKEKKKETEYIWIPEKKTKSAKKRKQIKWTPDLRREYIRDCETLSHADVLTKYQLASWKTAMQMKYLSKKVLERL